MNGLVAFVVWKSDVRHFVVLINVLAIVALAGFLAWSVFSRRGTSATPSGAVVGVTRSQYRRRRCHGLGPYTADPS